MGLSAVTFECSLTVPQNVKGRSTIWCRNSTPWHIPKRTENIGLYENLHTYIHSNITPNTQKVKIIQIPMKCWMHNQKVVCLYNGILFGNKKKWSIDECYNMDEPCKHYPKWKNSITKCHILYDSIYIKCPE